MALPKKIEQQHLDKIHDVIAALSVCSHVTMNSYGDKTTLDDVTWLLTSMKKQLEGVAEDIDAILVKSRVLEIEGRRAA